MELEDAIFAHLTGFAGLSALVGTRVSPDEALQGDDLPTVGLPLIRWRDFGTERTFMHSGDEGISGDHVQFDIFGETADSVRAVRRQLHKALKAWTGDGVNAAFLEGWQSSPDPDTGLFHVSVDVEIWNLLTIP